MNVYYETPYILLAIINPLEQDNYSNENTGCENVAVINTLF